jgi:hypothetical protein
MNQRRTSLGPLIVEGLELALFGDWLKQATVKGEHYCPQDPSSRAEKLIDGLQRQCSGADLFSFGQRFPDTSPRFDYPMRWDNLAVLQIASYADWWERWLSQDTRRNVRLATKRGLVLQRAAFSDELAAGIKEIYDETPIRQGRRFWHYGKDFETVRRENATFLSSSEFIVAHHGAEVVGFLKMVYLGKVATIMQIISKVDHFEKRPMNALIAKAVEVCSERGITHLIYRKYIYHRNAPDSLTEFKRRNGFEQVMIPRYFVPLTAKGRIALTLKLHLGLSELLPPLLVDSFRKVRAKYYERRFAPSPA